MNWFMVARDIIWQHEYLISTIEISVNWPGSKQLWTRPICTDFNGANWVFMRPYLQPPWTDFYQIWVVDVFHHAPPIHGIHNAEVHIITSVLYAMFTQMLPSTTRCYHLFDLHHTSAWRVLTCQTNSWSYTIEFVCFRVWSFLGTVLHYETATTFGFKAIIFDFKAAIFNFKPWVLPTGFTSRN